MLGIADGSSGAGARGTGSGANTREWAYGVRCVNGVENAVSWSTDRPEGFDMEHLRLLYALLPALTPVLELRAMHRILNEVLRIYVGQETGSRILSGHDRRHRSSTPTDRRLPFDRASPRGCRRVFWPAPGLFASHSLLFRSGALPATRRRRSGYNLGAGGMAESGLRRRS